MLTTMNQTDLVETNPTVTTGETAGINFYRPQTGTELASVVRAEHLNDLLANIQSAATAAGIDLSTRSYADSTVLTDIINALAGGQTPQGGTLPNLLTYTHSNRAPQLSDRGNSAAGSGWRSGDSEWRLANDRGSWILVRSGVPSIPRLNEFTWASRDPRTTDIGNKAAGSVWRSGTNEWRLNNGRNFWTPVAGAFSIYTDTTVRTQGSVRTLSSGRFWNSFRDLEFHIGANQNENSRDYQTPIRMSTFAWNRGRRVVVTDFNNTLILERSGTNQFRVVIAEGNEYVQEIVGIL